LPRENGSQTIEIRDVLGDKKHVLIP
jgi:hypothetical protein